MVYYLNFWVMFVVLFLSLFTTSVRGVYQTTPSFDTEYELLLQKGLYEKIESTKTPEEQIKHFELIQTILSEYANDFSYEDRVFLLYIAEKIENHKDWIKYKVWIDETPYPYEVKYKDTFSLSDGLVPVMDEEWINFVNENLELVWDSWDPYIVSVWRYANWYAVVLYPIWMYWKDNLVDWDGNFLFSEPIDYIRWRTETNSEYSPIIIDWYVNLLNEDLTFVFGVDEIKGTFITTPYDRLSFIERDNSRVNVLDMDWNILLDTWIDGKITRSWRDVSWFVYAVIGLDGKYNVINTKWEFLSDVWFDDVWFYSEWYIDVFIEWERTLDNKYNFMDIDGNFLFDDGFFAYDVWMMNNGLFLSNSSTSNILDKNLNGWTHENIEYCYAREDIRCKHVNFESNFDENWLAIIKIRTYDEVPWKFNYIDKEWNILLDEFVDNVWFFNNWIAPVSIDGKYNFINTSWEYICSERYDDVVYWTTDYIPVKKNWKWAFIDFECSLYKVDKN